jgi:hypothetical protein
MSWNFSPTKGPVNKMKPNYLLIPYLLIEEGKLQPLDYLVYSAIYAFSNLTVGRCTAKNTSIADICKTSPITVANSLLRLEESGYIKRVFKDESKRTRTEIIPLISMGKVSSGNDMVSSGNDTQVSSGDEQSININRINIKKGEDSASQGFKLLEVNRRLGKPVGVLINEIISLFKEINPLYQGFYKNTTQRKAIAELLSVYSVEEIVAAFKFGIKHRSETYFPTFNTPLQFKDKFPNLELKWEKRNK